MMRPPRRLKTLCRNLLARWGATLAARNAYERDALLLAQYIDCSTEALRQAQQHPERVNPDIRKRVCHWYLPPFENAFYGGIMTVLRLAAHLRERHGVRQRFLICGSCDPASLSEKIGSAFGALREAEVIALNSPEKIDSIPPADYSVATLWTTAYTLLQIRNTGYKFYMIQDYEPLFYPAGSTYAQAELTYRFGFYGITNTHSLYDIYTTEYGGTAVALTPAVDTTLFNPSGRTAGTTRKRVFYYARPGTPRNGFELAVAALRRLKDRYGDGVDIVAAGADWKPEEYGLQNVIRVLGTLPYEDTPSLYRSCHVGFVMMMTKHPSYLPFELMACGCLVVSNFNPANTWFLKNGKNCLLAPPTTTALYETLARALDRYEELTAVRRAGTDEVLTRYGDWEASLMRVARFMHAPHLARPSSHEAHQHEPVQQIR